MVRNLSQRLVLPSRAAPCLHLIRSLCRSVASSLCLRSLRETERRQLEVSTGVLALCRRACSRLTALRVTDFSERSRDRQRAATGKTASTEPSTASFPVRAGTETTPQSTAEDEKTREPESRAQQSEQTFQSTAAEQTVSKHRPSLPIIANRSNESRREAVQAAAADRRWRASTGHSTAQRSCSSAQLSTAAARQPTERLTRADSASSSSSSSPGVVTRSPRIASRSCRDFFISCHHTIAPASPRQHDSTAALALHRLSAAAAA